MAVDINITGEFKSNGVAAQPTLVSGTNIKTINGNSVLGSGNLVVSGGVTSVTGTAPVVSSGGTTPAISMAAATTSVNGYLTSTDWTTFNNKQAALVSGTNIKTINGNSLLGSGNLVVGGGGAQVGYRGFKYTITSQTNGPLPTPGSGQGVRYFFYDGEDSFYQGLYLNRVDADGVDLYQIGLKLINSPCQPYVLINPTGVTTVNEVISATFDGSYIILSATDSPNTGASGGVNYFHFSTSNPTPAYTGYTIHGHLNSTPVPVGSFFIAAGSSTLGTTFTSRFCTNVQAAGGYVYSWIQTESVMTGTMVLRTYRNSSAIGTALTIAAGSAAAIYNVSNNLYVGSGSQQLSLNITQTVLPSCNILGFGFRAV